MRLLLLSLFLPLSVVAQVSVSDPIVVADQDTYGNVRPRIVLNASGEPVVIWCNSGEEKIYCSRMEEGTFTEPLQLNPAGTGISSFDWYGPDIAAYGDTLAVVMKLEPEHTANSYIVMSHDGGETWSDTVRVETSAPLMSRMPAIGFDAAGNPMVAFLREDMEGFSEWALARSTDGGLSFEEPVSVSIGFTSAVCDCCPADILSSEEYVAVLYRNNEDNLRDIRASLSGDGGATFPEQLDMDDLDWEINACPSTGPSSMLSGDVLRSVWMSDATGDARIYHSSVELSGNTFQGSDAVWNDAGNISQNFPVLAGSGDLLGVVWENIQVTNRDVYFALAGDGSFPSGTMINLTESMDGYQVKPDMTGSDGVFHVVFSDNGGDAVVYLMLTVPAGIAEENIREDLLLFPNPTADRVNLTYTALSDERISLTLFAPDGAVVRRQELPVTAGTHTYLIDTSGLAAGIYTVHLRSMDHTEVLQMLITGRD